MTGPRVKPAMLDLTPSEQRVCDLLLTTRSRREIAERTGLTEGTVSHYIDVAKSKLMVEGVKELRAVLAARQGAPAA